MNELKRTCFEIIRDCPGITHRSIQRRLGIPDPAAEFDRPRVWQIASALASLRHERFAEIITTADGPTYYTPAH